MARGRNNLTCCGAARPAICDGPRLQFRIGKSKFFEAFHRPMTRLIELRRSGKPRADVVRQILHIRFQVALIGLHLLQNLCVHFYNRIRLWCFDLRHIARRPIRQRPPRQHLR